MVMEGSGWRNLQKTLALIKPDAVSAGKAVEIMQLIELERFSIIDKKHIQVRLPLSGDMFRTRGFGNKS